MDFLKTEDNFEVKTGDLKQDFEDVEEIEVKTELTGKALKGGLIEIDEGFAVEKEPLTDDDVRGLDLDSGERNMNCGLRMQLVVSSSVDDTRYLECDFRTRHPRHHGGQSSFVCGECGYAAANAGHLAQHVRGRHTGERPYKCDECDYASAQSSGLWRHHRRRHTGVRRHLCSECGFAALQASDLRRHFIARHTDERPHRCDVCPFATARKYHLQVHRRTVHSTARPFGCPECPYRAARDSQLRQHVTTHARLRRFACPLCAFTADKRSTLVKHCATWHTLRCHHCGHTTSRRARMVKHLKQHDKCGLPRPFETSQYECGTVALKSHIALHVPSHTIS